MPGGVAAELQGACTTCRFCGELDAAVRCAPPVCPRTLMPQPHGYLYHPSPAVRFEGQLNLHLNEVTTNLVPYPRLHFLLASMTPLGAATTATAASRQAGARSVHQVRAGLGMAALSSRIACLPLDMFGCSALHTLTLLPLPVSGMFRCAVPGPAAPEGAAQAGKLPVQCAAVRLCSIAHPTIHHSSPCCNTPPAVQHTYLACGLIARGSVAPSDLTRGIGRLRQQMRMAPWAEDAFKTGLCSCPVSCNQCPQMWLMRRCHA